MRAATSAKDAGRHTEAVALYRQAIGRDPRHAGAFHELGKTLQHLGDLDAAVLAQRAAVDIRPTYAEALLSLADLLRLKGDATAALPVCEDAKASAPGSALAILLHGIILADLGRLEEALVSIAEAAALQPRNTPIRLAQAHYLALGRRLGDAIAVLEGTIAYEPDNAVAHKRLGSLYQAAGDKEKAFHAFHRAVTIDEHYAEAYADLAMIMSGKVFSETGLAAARLAIRLDPALPQAHYTLGIILKFKHDLVAAIDAFRDAVRLLPDYAAAAAELFTLRQNTCDWTDLETDRSRMIDIMRRTRQIIPPFTAIASSDDPAEHFVCARLYASSFATHEAPLVSYAPRPVERRADRIRIGYVSTDFRTHAISTLFAELFECHDRSRFELFAYCIGTDEDNAMRRRLKASFDHFVTGLSGMPHRSAAQRIRDDGIDILVDLNGYTLGAQTAIFACRPAPIQVNYLGYPGTLGADCIDYIIGDPIVTPMDAQPFYSEAIVQLPDCYQPNDRNRPRASEAVGRASHGLPEGAFVYSCFNHTFKIGETTFAAWMRLLDATPGSVLWLLESNAAAADHLRTTAEQAGVDPKRLVFAPRVALKDHLERVGLADLFLDTLPYNAHTTTSDALWAGVPVVTCRGNAFAGRVAASLLEAMEMPELVTTSMADYEALALALAQDPARLAVLKAKLAEKRRTAPLFDTPRYARHFEAALTRMVDMMDAGQSPTGFGVAADHPSKAKAARTRPSFVTVTRFVGLSRTASG